MGSAVLSEHWADSDLHCNWHAPSPPHRDLTKAPRGPQGKAKLIIRNKVFECTTLLKIEVIEYGKMGFQMAWNAFSETKILMRGGSIPLSYSSHVTACAVGSSLWLSVTPLPLGNHSLWVQPFLFIYFVVFSLCQCVVYDSNFDFHLQLQYSKCNKEDNTMTYTICATFDR